MGQNRKVRQGRNKNKLDSIRFEEKFKAPLEKVEPKTPIFPNYDFKSEVQKDFGNEKRLLWVELIIILGIIVFALIRSFFLFGF